MHGADLHKRSFLTDGGKDNERQKKKAAAVIRSKIRPVTTAAFDHVCYHAAYSGTNDNESHSFYSRKRELLVFCFWKHRYTTEHVVTSGDPEPESLSVAAILLAQMIGAYKPVYL